MTDKLTPLRAVHQNCLECQGGSSRLVKECNLNTGPHPCPLWPYRLGRNPARAGIGANSHGFKKTASTKEIEAENANTEV